MSESKFGDIIGRILGKRAEEKDIVDSSNERLIGNLKAVKPDISREKIYVKAWVLKSLDELDDIKDEVRSGNIIILRLGPLAEKDAEDVKKAVNELYEFTQQIDGDIARLGKERIVLTPPFVRIWRGETT